MLRLTSLLCISAWVLGGCADLPSAKQAYQDGDYCTAAWHWQKLADKGFLTAQLKLAKMYQRGQCVEKSDKKALELLLAAEKNGDRDSYLSLARLYERGEGVVRDGSKADYYYQLAVETTESKEDTVKALYSRGRMYARGEIVPPNPTKALMLYEQAAQLGDGDSMMAIAKIIRRKREAALAKWYGFTYHHGVISSQDFETARAIILLGLYQAAAQKGDADAGLQAATLRSTVSSQGQSTAQLVALRYQGVGASR